MRRELCVTKISKIYLKILKREENKLQLVVTIYLLIHQALRRNAKDMVSLGLLYTGIYATQQRRALSVKVVSLTIPAHCDITTLLPRFTIYHL